MKLKLNPRHDFFILPKDVKQVSKAQLVLTSKNVMVVEQQQYDVLLVGITFIFFLLTWVKFYVRIPIA